MLAARRTLLTTLSTAALLAAGCGGDDESPGKLAKADLAKAADAVCVTFQPKVEALGEPTDVASFKTYLEQFLPVAADRRKALVALQPDDDVKAEWEDLIKDYDASVDGAKQALAALAENDEAEFQRIVEDARVLNEESEKKLDAFGAPRCGSKSDEA